MSHIIITVAVVLLQLSPEGKSLTVPAIPFLHIGKSPLSSDRPHLPKLQKKNEAEIWKLRRNCRFRSGSFLSLESWTLHISWINYPFLMANLVCQAIYLHFPIMLSPIYKPLSQLGTLILNWKRTRSIAIYCKKKLRKAGSQGASPQRATNPLSIFEFYHIRPRRTPNIKTVCWFPMIWLLLVVAISWIRNLFRSGLFGGKVKGGPESPRSFCRY